MSQLIKRTSRRTINDQVVAQLEHLHPVLQKIYAARAIQTVDDLSTELIHLIPYHQLTTINVAVERLITALEQQQRVLIIGDFDADGATSCALAVTALRLFGLQDVTYLVPNRFDYGYGLTPEIVTVAAKWKPNLLITVDNGITSHQGVEAAKQLNMDVIITDHHLPAETLPAAVAVVNPNQQGDDFPSKHLAGVGVIFYVMLALRRALCTRHWFEKQGIAQPNMSQFLDLVALGTVADVVPLDQNNRILIQQGLARIRQGACRPGILALLKVAKRTAVDCVASDLGFAVAPRLNAAGRLDDMSLGIECLLTDDRDQAQQLACQLDQLNRERQTIEAEIQQQALVALDQLRLNEQTLPEGLCLYDAAWHQGIIGIVAGRLKEKFHRPAMVFAKVSESELKGSARSVPGVHIRDVLADLATQQPQLMTKFGGHAMAAGVSLPLEQYEVFKQLFTAAIARTVSAEQLRGGITTDGQLLPKHVTLEVAELIRAGGPWGQMFPEPLFDGQFQVLDQRIVGEKHLKLVLKIPKTALKLDAIAFNVDRELWPNPRCQEITAVYKLDVNEYQGWRSLQLIVDELEAINLVSI